MRGLAQAFGATEANSAAKARTPMTVLNGEKILGSTEDTVRSLRATAAGAAIRKTKFHDKVDDDHIRALTGLTVDNPRAYLAARVKNQMPEELKQAGPMTMALRKDQRTLGRRNRTLLNRQAEEAEAQKLMDNLMQNPLPEGEVIDTGKGAYIFRAPGGTERLFPDVEAKELLGRQAEATRIQETLAEAQTKRVQAEKNLESMLGEAIPPDRADDQLAALRAKHLPPELAAIDESLVPPAKAREMWRQVALADEEQLNKFQRDVSFAGRQEAEDLLLADFVENHPTGGVPLPRKKAAAATLLSKHNELLTKGHAIGNAGKRYADLPRERAFTFDEYGKVTNFIASAEPDPKKFGPRWLDTILKGPGGTYIVGADGHGLEPRTLKSLDLENGTAAVHGPFQSPDVPDIVPLDHLRFRFSPEQMALQEDALNRAQKLRRGLPHPTTGAPLTERTLAGYRKALPKPQPLASERLWLTRNDYDTAVSRAEAAKLAGRSPRGGADVPVGRFLDEEIADTWNKFQETFMPAGNVLETRALTPEYVEKQVRGMQNIMLRQPRKGASPVEVAQHYEYQMQFMQGGRAFIGSKLAVTDVNVLEDIGMRMRENPADPMLPMLLMMEQSPADVLNIVSDTPGKFTGALGQFVDHHLVGEAISHPQAKAILTHSLMDQEVSANYVASTYGTSRMFMGREAAKLLGKTVAPALKAGEQPSYGSALRSLRGSTARGIKAATREIPHPGRAVSAFADEFSPISHEKELSALLRKEFRPESLGHGMGKKIMEWDEPKRETATAWLTTQFRTFMDDPEAFPALASNKEFSALRNQWRAWDDLGGAEQHVMHATQQTNARRLAMLMQPEVRAWPEWQILEKDGATKLDLFDEVWKRMDGDPSKTMAALTQGADADMVHPMAGFQSMAMQQVVDKLKGLGLANDDIYFGNGNWHFKSLNKLPKDVAESVKNMGDILTGKHQWQGLQRMSQQIALGVLALDMSVFGIQGFKYMAHSLVAGNPIKAAQVIGKGLTTIMSDYGFYSWMQSDMDEIMYYSSLGLTGGLKGTIAGPPIRRAPLENLPYVAGALAKTAYAASDLQYNRALFYWKVQGVRQNLETAKMLRSARGHVSDKFLADLVDSSPTLKATVDDMGGLENYHLGATEDTVKSVIRQVNRSMGGVNLEAEGIGTTRRAIEQIMTIVPGFFRGQIGQWAAVITKPHTLEGQLAASMLAQEYMFGAMVATGFSRLLGTEDKINWDDMTKPTWLGVPLPDSVGGGTINIIPTMAVPRLLSRSVKATVETARGEGGFGDYEHAFEAFAHGRLSPVVGAFYDGVVKNEDFLGRKYESNLEKWGMILSGSVLPVVVQSAIEDINEGAKRKQATGNFGSAEEMALSTGLNFLGKGVVPQHPADRLNNIAKQIHGTDWQLLTDAEKDDLRKTNPAATAAEAEYDFWSGRRAGSDESQIDAAYKGYEANVNKLWFERTSIKGIASSQGEDDDALTGGMISGDTWRERYHVRQQAASQWYESLRQELDRAGVDPEKVRTDRMARMEEGRPEDRAVLLQLARNEYRAVKPKAETRVLTTPNGEVEQEVVDWSTFFADREEVLSKYPEELREAARRSARADELPGLETYRQAAMKQREIEAMGRYRGLTADQGDQVDRMRAVVGRVGEALRGQTGAGQASGASIPQQLVQHTAIQEMVKSGVIKDEGDMQLVALAFAMSKSDELAETMRNPNQIRAILASPEAVLYYPYLRWRIPQALWPQLPQQIFQAPVVEAQMASLQ